MLLTPWKTQLCCLAVEVCNTPGLPHFMLGEFHAPVSLVPGDLCFAKHTETLLRPEKHHHKSKTQNYLINIQN